MLAGFLLALSLQTPKAAPDPTPSGPPALTAQDLSIFLDGLVPSALARYEIAGAVVAVVKDGHLLFTKGYGSSDVAKQLPVSPDSTLFRVASISKLFNATAVMQLVEQKRLDLDEDIDKYLDFKIPRRFPDKITLRHLLTHTAGFQESFKQLPAPHGKGVSLADWIHQMTPDQIYRPGTITSYSNYGADLAGFIVQLVSGMPYAEYMRVHVLEPLGMFQSSIAEPLPASLMAKVSKGYSTARDTADEYEVLQGEPSGNMATTATDIAKFAIAHLGLGSGAGAKILDSATARLMATTQFRTHPEVPGMGLGFFEEHRNGYRIIGHGGDLSAFHSHLSLLMDEGVGFFVSVNSAGRGASLFGARETIRNGFLDRYFPRKIPLEPIAANPEEIAARVVGGYTMSRRGETTMARAVGAVIDLSVRANPDSSVSIVFVTGPDGQPVHYYPIDSTTFRTADGSELIGYVEGKDGLPSRIALFGGHELHRIGFADRTSTMYLALGTIAILLGGSLLLWPIAALIRRRYQVRPIDDGVAPRLRVAARLVAAAALGFLVAIVLFMTKAFSGSISPDSRSDPLLIAIRVLGLVAILGTIVSVIAFNQSFTGKNRWAQLKYGGLVVGGLVFSWFVIHWRLVSTNLRY